MIEQILSISFLTAFFAASVRLAVPLVYAGLGEVFLQKTGIVNIGLEGVMLNGALFSFIVASITGNTFLGLLAGMLGGVLVSAIHGLLCIKCHQDQSVSGIAINIFMVGVTGFLFKIFTAGSEYSQVEVLETIRIPLLADIPVIGEALFHQDILTYSLYVLVVLCIYFYKKTSLGLSFLSIGGSPKAADAAGIDVYRYQWIAIAVNGILGGIGGAVLVLVQVGRFTENMVSGRGYIALAAVILGKYSPKGLVFAALLFGGASALQIRLQAMGVALPPQILQMLPYVITLVVLFTSVSKKSQPKALGKPYFRGER